MPIEEGSFVLGIIRNIRINSAYEQVKDGKFNYVPIMQFNAEMLDDTVSVSLTWDEAKELLTGIAIFSLDHINGLGVVMKITNGVAKYDRPKR